MAHTAKPVEPPLGASSGQSSTAQSEFPPPPERLMTAIRCKEELLCARCNDSLRKPLECVPCAHLFCKECIRPLTKCPTCKAVIEGFQLPPRALLEMAESTEVRCKDCFEIMTTAASHAHHCVPRRQAPNAALPVASSSSRAAPAAIDKSKSEPPTASPSATSGGSPKRVEEIDASAPAFKASLALPSYDVPTVEHVCTHQDCKQQLHVAAAQVVAMTLDPSRRPPAWIPVDTTTCDPRTLVIEAVCGTCARPNCEITEVSNIDRASFASFSGPGKVSLDGQCSHAAAGVCTRGVVLMQGCGHRLCIEHVKQYIAQCCQLLISGKSFTYFMCPTPTFDENPSTSLATLFSARASPNLHEWSLRCPMCSINDVPAVRGGTLPIGWFRLLAADTNLIQRLSKQLSREAQAADRIYCGVCGMFSSRIGTHQCGSCCEVVDEMTSITPGIALMHAGGTRADHFLSLEQEYVLDRERLQRCRRCREPLCTPPVWAELADEGVDFLTTAMVPCVGCGATSCSICGGDGTACMSESWHCLTTDAAVSLRNAGWSRENPSSSVLSLYLAARQICLATMLRSQAQKAEAAKGPWRTFGRPAATIAPPSIKGISATVMEAATASQLDAGVASRRGAQSSTAPRAQRKLSLDATCDVD